MAKITFQSLAHSYGGSIYALKRLDFSFEDGGAYALLGPSGCGKTTLLNIISGLVHPSEGRVLFGDTDVTAKGPAERNIAQVFQFPVIYDTMTVRENLAFPLKNRGVDESTIKRRVGEVAEMLELGPMLGRRASGLTADQKQKISVGRGLVREDVAAILFDEPLTVIDPHLKWQLRRKLKEVHARFRNTLVYVTHDQNEALTFADQVVVMYEGEMVQVGTPQELFERPAHRFVGWFIGSPGMNFLPCTPAEGGLAIEGTDIRIAKHAPSTAPAPLALGIRPEFVGVQSEPGNDTVPVPIERVDDLGNFKLVTGRLGPHALVAKVPEDRPVPDGLGHFALPPQWLRLYADERLAA
ncbi:MAG: ABC transporter ATP-binding protein [Geminicoccaceae bacterium]